MLFIVVLGAFLFFFFFFFFKQKTAYEMRISDWSSDVCSSDLSEKLQLLNILGQCISHRTENDISAFVVGFGDAIEHVVDHINIIPAAAGQSILACTTIQMIVTYITRQGIVPCSAD